MRFVAKSPSVISFLNGTPYRLQVSELTMCNTSDRGHVSLLSRGKPSYWWPQNAVTRRYQRETRALKTNKRITTTVCDCISFTNCQFHQFYASTAGSSRKRGAQTPERCLFVWKTLLLFYSKKFIEFWFDLQNNTTTLLSDVGNQRYCKYFEIPAKKNLLGLNNVGKRKYIS